MIAKLNAALAPISGIATPGPDLGELVTAVTKILATFTSAINKITTEIVDVTTQTNRIISKIASKMTTLGC